MDSCGSPTRVRARHNGDGRGRACAWERLALVLGTLAVTALTGCISIRYGTPPHLDHLASLRPGVSTSTDVLLALGEPRGRGVARFSSKYAPRDIWFYEYAKATSTVFIGSDIGLTILLVFVEADRYEGYLWFSSIGSVTRTSASFWTPSAARSGEQP